MKTSNGERQIIEILNREGIKFIREKRFKDLKRGLLRFDFYIPSLGVLLEVDGAQHFHQVKKFQRTYTEFLQTQGRDRAKNSYCLAKGILLYRVPYWELPNIQCARDIFQEKFRVKVRGHNDKLRKFDKKK